MRRAGRSRHQHHHGVGHRLAFLVQDAACSAPACAASGARAQSVSSLMKRFIRRSSLHDMPDFVVVVAVLVAGVLGISFFIVIPPLVGKTRRRASSGRPALRVGATSSVPRLRHSCANHSRAGPICPARQAGVAGQATDGAPADVATGCPGPRQRDGESIIVRTKGALRSGGPLKQGRPRWVKSSLATRP